MNLSVKEMQNIDLQGNIIPHNWYNAIKKSSGSVDYISILTLAEIVYWYRPSYQFDDGGRVVGIKQKFSEDVLQKSYDDFSIKLGMTKRQVRDSVVRLEEMGLIVREFRNVVIRGVHLSNVLYIHLNVDKLKEITYIKNSCDVEKEGVLRKKETPLTPNVDTYTKITSKTTTDINNNIVTSEEDDGRVTNATKQMNEDIRKIFDYWNSKKITVHQKFTEPMKTRLRTVIKNYGIEELLTVINNYATVYHSDKHYFNYKYTLMQITRTKDMDQFGSEADPLHNFLKDKGGNNSYAAKRESDLMTGRRRRDLN